MSVDAFSTHFVLRRAPLDDQIGINAPARGAPQALLTADERDEIAGMATADDGLFASVEAQLSGLGAAPDA